MRFFAASLVALALAPNALAAAKSPVFGLRAVGNPKVGYFVYQAAPGASRSGAVIVSNVGSAAGRVHLFTADATTGPTSGTVYKTDTKPTGPGAWVKLAQTSFVLSPGASRRVPFTVQVPSGQEPGQWVGGIVAEAARQVATQKPGQKARVQIRIRDLTIVAVQVDVPGPRAVDFAIGKVTTGGTRGFQKLLVHIDGRSNVLVNPTGAVTVRDKNGNVVETLPFTMDTFLPQTSIDFPILLKKALPAGDYEAKVTLNVPAVAGVAAKRFTAQPSFSVSSEDVKQVFTSAPPQAVPAGATSSEGTPLWVWIAAAAAAAALVLLLLLLGLFLRRRRGAPAAPPTTVHRQPTVDELTGPPPRPVAATARVPEEPAHAATAVATPPPPAAAAPESDHEHEWDVAYDRGELGADGVWRFPHRCRHCGASLLARDVQDATAQSAAR